MLKKITLTCGVILATMSTAHAAFYAGPMLGLINNSSQNGNYRGLQPTLAVGYNEMVSSCTYMAVEAFGAPFNIMLDDNTPSGSSLRSTYSLGASLIPGYLITDNVIGYLRVGLITTKFGAPNATRAGGQFGLGVQTGLTDEWQLRFEYDYAAYRQASDIGAVKADQIFLGLIFNFLQ